MCSKPLSSMNPYKSLIILNNTCELSMPEKRDRRFTAKKYVHFNYFEKTPRLICYFIRACDFDL